MINRVPAVLVVFCFAGVRPPASAGSMWDDTLSRRPPLGVIREYAYADILLIRGNPLENPSILADHVNDTNLIMQDGMIYKSTLPPSDSE